MPPHALPVARRGAGVVRLADVAALAHVSIGTASKALNGTGQLRAETRARVTRAAERLGFTTNAVARGLASGRTFTVGVLTTDSFGRFSIPVMLGAEDALGAGQVAVLLCDTRDDPLREQHYVRALRGRQVDGIIVTGRRTEPRPPLGRESGTAAGVPVVYAFTPSADPADCSVVSDDVGGSRLAVEHLLDLGRTRVAVVTGPAHHRSATRRADAAHTALSAAGLEPAMPVRFGSWSEAWGRHAAVAVARTDVDAVVCGSDQVARGVVDGLREAGRRVPDQVAVVGFDNWDVMATASRPPLTTVDMRLQSLGQRAAGLLLDSIDGRVHPGLHSMSCELVVRGSTQPG